MQNPTKTLAVLAFSAMGLLLTLTPVSALGGAGYGGFDLLMSVQVNDQVCTTIPVQCSQLGAPFEAPASGNRAAVQLVVQLIRPTLEPLTGRTESDFKIESLFVPAGGSSIEVVSCEDCFQTTGDGLYGVFVQPVGSNTWKSGTYTFQLSADVGSLKGRSLLRIDVP